MCLPFLPKIIEILNHCYENIYIYIYIYFYTSHFLTQPTSGETGRGAEYPQRFLTEKFLLIYREKRGKERNEKGVKAEKKRRKKEKCKREGGKLKMEGGKVTKWGEDFFFFLAFYYSKPLKFVLGLPKWKFSTRKKHFTPGKKKKGKMTMPTQKNFPVTPLHPTYSLDLSVFIHFHLISNFIVYFIYLFSF